jgi:hypothetical protein
MPGDDLTGALFRPIQIKLAGGIGNLFLQFVPVFFESVRDVLQEDQPEHDVLVLRRVHMSAQLVGRRLQSGFEGSPVSVCLSLSIPSCQSTSLKRLNSIGTPQYCLIRY